MMAPASLALLLLLAASQSVAAEPFSCGFRPSGLRSNNLANPLGVPTGEPRLSWQLTAPSNPPQRGLAQAAYRIQCSSKPGGGSDLWDSGKVASAESLQIPYGGKPLKSSQKVYWGVSVWDTSGAECTDSSPEPAWFETALLDEAAWQGAQWLARYDGKANETGCELYAETERTQAPRFRREFSTAGDSDSAATVVTARAYISGLGYYQMYIDGERVGTSRLDPGWTTYDHTVLYACYDVTSLVNSGGTSHTVGVELGNGWWNPLPLLFWGHDNLRDGLMSLQGRTSSEPMFKLLMVATMSDGSEKVHHLVRPPSCKIPPAHLTGRGVRR